MAGEAVTVIWIGRAWVTDIPQVLRSRRDRKHLPASSMGRSYGLCWRLHDSPVHLPSTEF